VSGSGNADDATREAESGECLLYNWTLPEDHWEGTFWYHAHTRGLTDPQVAGGAFGLVVVVSDDLASDDLGVVAWLENEDLRLIAATIDDVTTGNGIVGGDAVDLIADEWYRLRVVTVDPEGVDLELQLTEECEARAVAFDGVWLFDVPGPNTDGFYVMTGASRVDLALRCWNSSVILLNDEPVMWLDVVDGPTSIATPFANNSYTWEPRNRPTYLRDLRNVTVDDDDVEIEITSTAINGLSYDPDVPLDATVYYDSVQEWTILGRSRHPFHLHVYHVQVVTPGGCGNHEEGQYYDVIYAPDVDCRVRFHVVDFGERVMLHCHFLAHEDAGAMTWINVTQNPDPAAAQMPLQPTTDAAPAICGDDDLGLR